MRAEECGIGGGIIVGDGQRRDHGAGVGQRLAGGEAEPLGGFVEGDEAERVLDLGDDGERRRLLSGRGRCGGGFPVPILPKGLGRGGR